MELINKIRKSRKGFTLVEIIVVLIILAILAAFTIPAMLGFVEDARGKAMIAEAREVYVAAQATATEYGATTEIDDKELSAALSSATITTPSADQTKAKNQMDKYLGSDIDDAEWTVIVGLAAENEKTAQVKSVKYEKDNYTITISGNNATVEKS